VREKERESSRERDENRFKEELRDRVELSVLQKEMKISELWTPVIRKSKWQLKQRLVDKGFALKTKEV